MKNKNQMEMILNQLMKNQNLISNSQDQDQKDCDLYIFFSIYINF